MFDKNQKLHLQESSYSNDTNLGIEAEYITLPSQGMFYKGKYKNVPLLKVKKLSYIEEDILATQSYYDNGTLFNEILKSVIVDKNFPVEELVEIDRITILWWLYIYAFGRKYETLHFCSGCKKETIINWDLALMSTSDYPLDYLKSLHLDGYIQLTLNSNHFYIVPPEANRALEIETFFKTIDPEKSFVTTKKLLCSIIKIVDWTGAIHTSIENIYLWLKNNTFTLKDSRQIQECIKQINIEVNTTQTNVCLQCGQEEIIKFPMTINFFRLDVIKYREYLEKSINFLHFWGKLDYNSCLRMPTHKRKAWIIYTNSNLEILYPKSK